MKNFLQKVRKGILILGKGLLMIILYPILVPVLFYLIVKKIGWRLKTKVELTFDAYEKEIGIFKLHSNENEMIYLTVTFFMSVTLTVLGFIFTPEMVPYLMYILYGLIGLSLLSFFMWFIQIRVFSFMLKRKRKIKSFLEQNHMQEIRSKKEVALELKAMVTCPINFNDLLQRANTYSLDIHHIIDEVDKWREKNTLLEEQYQTIVDLATAEEERLIAYLNPLIAQLYQDGKEVPYEFEMATTFTEIEAAITDIEKEIAVLKEPLEAMIQTFESTLIKLAEFDGFIRKAEEILQKDVVLSEEADYMYKVLYPFKDANEDIIELFSSVDELYNTIINNKETYLASYQTHKQEIVKHYNNYQKTLDNFDFNMDVHYEEDYLENVSEIEDKALEIRDEVCKPEALLVKKLIQEQDKATILKLVSIGLDLHKLQQNNETYLHQAAACGSLEIVSYLLEEGVDAFVQNNDSLLAIDLSYLQDHKQVTVEILKATMIQQPKEEKKTLSDTSKKTESLIAFYKPILAQSDQVEEEDKVIELLYKLSKIRAKSQNTEEAVVSKEEQKWVETIYKDRFDEMMNVAEPIEATLTHIGKYVPYLTVPIDFSHIRTIIHDALDNLEIERLHHFRTILNFFVISAQALVVARFSYRNYNQKKYDLDKELTLKGKRMLTLMEIINYLHFPETEEYKELSLFVPGVDEYLKHQQEVITEQLKVTYDVEPDDMLFKTIIMSDPKYMKSYGEKEKFYQVLGLDQTATEKEIENAHQEIILQLHHTREQETEFEDALKAAYERILQM